MSKNLRLQIPLNQQEIKLFRSAAKVYQVSAAEWARRVLFKAAQRDLSAEVVMDPLQAVQVLAQLEAPVADVAVMKKESIKGRLQ